MKEFEPRGVACVPGTPLRSATKLAMYEFIPRRIHWMANRPVVLLLRLNVTEALFLRQSINEMVFAGDTDISLHIRPGPISNWGWGCILLGKPKLKILLSAKIYLNLNIRGRGFSPIVKTDMGQVLAKFSFSWGAGVGWGG